MYLGIHNQTGQLMAVKQIPLEEGDPDRMARQVRVFFWNRVCEFLSSFFLVDSSVHHHALCPNVLPPS